MSKILSPPTLKPSRVSVPVTSEVLEAFQRLAKAGNTSTGKAMAVWLADTVDGARFMAETLEKARIAPKKMAQELHAYALGLSDETGQLINEISSNSKLSAGVPGRVAKRLPGARADLPPSCNTGGKVPTGTKSGRGGKSP